MLDVKAAIFDMDGTLVDSLMLWDILTDAMAKAYPDKVGTVITEEDNKAIRVLPLRDGMQLLHDHYGIAASGEELFQLATDTFADFYANRVQLKEGVREFLDHLHTRGVKMCIASATNPDLVESAMGIPVDNSKVLLDLVAIAMLFSPILRIFAENNANNLRKTCII